MFSWLSSTKMKKKKKTTQVFSCKIGDFYKKTAIFFKIHVVNLFYKNYVK